MQVLVHFGPKKIRQEKLRNSQRFWTISSLHLYIFVPNCSNVPNIYIFHKKIQKDF